MGPSPLRFLPAEVAMLNRGWIVVVWAPLALSAVLAFSGRAQATPARLIGAIRDTSGVPVPLAQVSSSGLRTLTDSGGRFTLPGLPYGSVSVNVRRLGYEPRDTSMNLAIGRVDSLLVVLAILPRELAGVLTEANALDQARLAEFYRHKRSGGGTFIDRARIEDERISRTSDLLRRLPGIRMGTDRAGRSIMRMGRAVGGRDCPPDFWIDGVRAAFMNVDDIPIQDIEALEIYRGPSGLPPEYNSRFGNPGCGAVIIWTRLPG